MLLLTTAPSPRCRKASKDRTYSRFFFITDGIQTDAKFMMTISKTKRTSMRNNCLKTHLCSVKVQMIARSVSLHLADVFGMSRMVTVMCPCANSRHAVLYSVSLRRAMATLFACERCTAHIPDVHHTDASSLDVDFVLQLVTAFLLSRWINNTFLFDP